MKVINVIENNNQDCDKLTEILKTVKENFELEVLNTEDSKFTIRKRARAFLNKYATANVPFLLFVRDDGVEYAAHYQEEGLPTKVTIENKMKKAL